MFEDGPQRSGRFLKGNSKLIKKVKLSEFSFKELCEVALVLPDNSSKSIIHSKYHPESIEERISPSTNFFEDFQADGSLRRPILQPIDFTAEVEAIRKRKKANRNRDEDDFLGFGEFGDEEETTMSTEENEDDENSSSSDSPQEAPGEVFGEEDEDEFAAHHDSTSDEVNDIADDGLSSVGNAINELVNTESHITPPPLSATDPTALAANTHKNTDGFIPVNINDQHPLEPNYENQSAPSDQAQMPTQEEVDSIMSEAKAKGYEDGYRQGEEKALIQSKSENSQLFGKVSELISEFNGLKRDILENVQENFYEIVLATAEAFIKKEFATNPESFATVIQRAIDESIKDDSIKILVHPDMLAKLQQANITELQSHLAADKEIPFGEFKIESQLSVVDGNIRKIVQEMLDNTNIELFDEGEKAS